MITGEFDYVEYIAFITMLSLSLLIGIYFGCIKGGQDTVSGYLLGGKRMTVLPIVMSLVSTHISGITLLGLPTEVYMFGTQFLLISFPAILSIVFSVFAILPVFHKLQLISLYEYLELRFSNSVRLIVSFMFVLSWLTYVPTVIYGPGLALNQVSGMNVHVVTPIVSIICIIYTTLGGLKAVVWSDTLQATVMLGSVTTVMILGIYDVGGISQVFRSAIDGDRLELFNMDLHPNARISFWSCTIGLFFMQIINLCCSPTVVQRYMSLPTLREARNSSLGLGIGGTLFIWLSGFTGLVIYAKYKDCNPLASKMINRPDQILPLFVIHIATKVRGLSGLFMAGIVCAALSTMSTGLNTLSGIIYEDFLEPLFSKKPSEKKASTILKCLAVCIGVVSVLLVALIEKLGQLIEIAQAFGGMTGGPMAGIFVLALFCPSANTKGTLIGSVISLAIMTWLMAGNIIGTSNGFIKHVTKPMSLKLCPVNVTETLTSTEIPSSALIGLFPLYKISVFYYSLIGCLIVLVIGIPVSLLTGGNKDRPVDPKLLSPLVPYYCDIKENYKYNSIQLKTVN